MASVETPQQRRDAQAKGYRSFRVRLPEQSIEPGEFVCPASSEAGKRTTCAECGACNGAAPGTTRATPVIVYHGSAIANNRNLRLYRETMERIHTAEAGRIPLAIMG